MPAAEKYVAHQAWLNTAPFKPGKKGKPTQERREHTRMQDFYQRGVTAYLTMPDAKGSQYLIEAMHEAGSGLPGQNGRMNPLTWQEIDAWMRATGAEFEWWETDAIYRLSRCYCNWLAKASDPNCPAPYTDPGALTQARQSVGDGIKRSLQRMAESQKRQKRKKAGMK